MRLTQLETFSNSWTGKFPSDFLQRLDRMFDRLTLVNQSVATTLNGYTLKSDDRVESLRVDTSAGNTTIYLPSQPVGYRRRTVMKTVAANVLIIDGNGALIFGPGGWAAGVTQAFLNGQWESLTFEPTGTSWVVVASVP